MNKLKKIGIIATSVVAVFYIAYLLILPNIIDLTFAKDMIKNLAKDSAGIEVNIDKIKLTTGFPLNAGVKVSGVNLICADKSQPAKVGSLSARVNLFPLLFKKISIKDVNIDSLEADTSISKDGKFAVEKCFIFPEQNQDEQSSENSFDFKLANRLPVVTITNTKVSLKDEETSSKLALNLDNLKLDRAVLNKQFRIFLIGKLKLNDKDNMKFNILADSYMPEFSQNDTKEETAETSYINFIKEFEKYNLLADINADLKIRNNQNKIIMDGFANIDGLSFKIDKEQLPQSFLHTKFTHKQGELNSEIFVSKDEKFVIESVIKNSKNVDLDASFKTEKISFNNLQKIAVAVLSTLNISNDINSFKTKGYIVSDLKIKTNSKNLTSAGSLNIKNAEIISNKLGLFIKDFHSNIDLKNNSVTIKDTSAKINDALIEVKGTIDEKANANVTVFTNKLPIAKLSQAFLTGDLKNTYQIKSGLLDLNLLAKGRLDSIKPEITAKLSTLEIFDKVNKMTLSNSSTAAKITTDGKTFGGDIVLSDTKAILSQMGVNVSVPTLKVNILPDSIKIDNSKILVNNSQFVLLGEIKNYLKTPDINIKLNGGLIANDLKKLLPKEYTSFVSASGTLPIKVAVTGSKDISATAQIFANSTNNLNVAQIDKLNNKNSILNADILISGNNININDAGIYTVNVSSLSDNLKNNIANGKEVVVISGQISAGNAFKNLKVDLKDTLGIKAFNISLNTHGHLTLNGSMNSPLMSGNFTASNINAPDYLIKGQLVNINLTPSEINLDLLGLDLNGSTLDAKISMLPDFNMPLIISNANIDAQKIDLDKVLVITSKFAAPSPAPVSTSSTKPASQLIPVTIKKGFAKIEGFKIATISANNITSDFTLAKDVLDMNNIKATAYDGNLSGQIKYNLNTLKMDAKLFGENMAANPAVTSLIAIKDQIMGTLKFDADISMKGATIEEQLRSLKGTANFEVKDGQLGSLGKFETYLKAINLASSSIVNLSINKIISVVLPYNSGQIATATGKLSFDNGNVKFDSLKTSGKEMGLYITGSLNMLNYNANMVILGRLNQEMTDILGELGKISVEKIVGYIPVVGKIAPNLLKMYNATAPKTDISQIPQLTPKASSKTFKVVINGSIMSAKFVKSFHWLTTEEVLSETEKEVSQKFSIQTKEEIVNEIKTQLQAKSQAAAEEAKKKQEEFVNKTQAQVKEKLDNSKAIQNLKTLGTFLKNASEQQQTPKIQDKLEK